MSQATVSKLVGGLNLRIAPGLKAQIVDTAKPGDVVEVLTRLQSGWVYVSYKGQRGYMWGQHLVDAAEEAFSDVEVFEDRPPVWLWVAGVATLAIGFVAAVAFILR